MGVRATIVAGLCLYAAAMLGAGAPEVHGQTPPAQTSCEIERAKRVALEAWERGPPPTGAARPPSPHPDLLNEPGRALKDLRAFVPAHPQHLCIDEYRARLEMREARIAAFAADGSGGPRNLRLLNRPISAGDYPMGDDMAAGLTTVRLLVEADGRVDDCRVTRSSGSPRLDRATCRLLLTRARFDPARDEDGRPEASLASQSVDWRLMEYEPADPPAADKGGQSSR